MPKPKFCWDACIFIAILTGEQRSEDERQGLFEVIDYVERDAAIVVTSALLRTEVLDRAGSTGVRSALDAMFRRPAFVITDVNAAIADRAAALRQQVLDSGGSIKTPDAIYVATALAHRVDALHTFDERILRLNGAPAVEGLPIVKPRAAQTVLVL
jgi:predicted nucleic acid-binding protein